MGLKDEMQALVSSVNEHKKFKQLACYSMDCLGKVLAAPNARWRENLHMATECGAARTIVDVLKLHPGKPEVLLNCSDTLAKLAVDARNAEIIAEEGGIEALLASVEAADDLPPSAMGDALSLLENICQHPKALEYIAKDPALVQRLLNMIGKSNDDTPAAAAVVRVLEKISKTPDGPRTLLATETVDILTGYLDRLAGGEVLGEAEEEIVVQASKVLLRLERVGGRAAIRGTSGPDTYLRLLEAFPDSDRIARIAGKVLAKMMGDSVPELLGNLSKPGALQERTLMLLATLATNSTTAGNIVSNGGLQALLDAYDSMSSKGLEQMALMIERLASNAANIQDIVASGLLDKLVASLTDPRATPESSAAALSALATIAGAGDFVGDVLNAGALAAAADAIKTHGGNDPDVGRTGLHFLSVVAASDAVTPEQLLELGLLPPIMAVVNGDPDSYGTQLVALRAMRLLSEAAGAVPQMVAGGMVGATIANVNSFVPERDLVVEAMGLLTTFSVTDAATVTSLGGLDAAVAALVEHPKEAEVRSAAQGFVAGISSPELLNTKVGALVAAERRIADGDYSKVQEIPAVAMNIGTLAIVRQNAETLVASGATTVVTSTLRQVADIDKVPQQAAVLATLMHAMQELLLNDRTGGAHAQDEEILAAALKALRSHGKSPEVAIQALKTIALLSTSAAARDHCIEEGTLEAVGMMLDRHADNPAVVEAAAKVLSSVCDNDTRAQELARRRIMPSAFKALSTLAEEPNEDAKETARVLLRLVARASSTPETRDIVADTAQATDVVIALMDAYTLDASFQEECVATLEAFLREQDVLPIVRKLKLVSRDVVAGSGEKKLERIRAVVAKLGVFLLAGDFSSLVQEAGGIQVLVDVINGAQQASASAERNELIRTALAALGRAAGEVDVENAVGVVPFLLEALELNATKEVLRAVRCLAKDVGVRQALLEGGVVEKLMPLISGVTSSHVAEEALRTVATLAKDPVGAQDLLAHGGLGSVVDFLVDNVDNGRKDALPEALEVLKGLAENADGPALEEVGVLEALGDVLAVLDKAGTLEPQELHAITQLLSTLAAHEPQADAMLAKGVVAKQLTVLEASSQFRSDPDVVSATAKLLETLCAHPGSVEQLQRFRAQEVLLASMQEVGAVNIATLNEAAAALALISGSSTNNLASVLTRIDGWVQGAKEAPAAADAAQLKVLLDLVSNLLLLPDALDGASGKKLEATLYRALEALHAMPARGSQQAAMAAALDVLGRLVTVEAAQADVVKAAVEASTNLTDDATPVVMEAACGCVGNLALTAAGVQALAAQRILPKVQEVAADMFLAALMGGEGAARAAAEALARVEQHCVENAAVMVASADAPITISEILLGMADSKPRMATLQAVLKAEGGARVMLDTLVALHPENPAGKEEAITALVTAMLGHRDENNAEALVTTDMQASAIASAMKLEKGAVVLLEGGVGSVEAGRILAANTSAMRALASGVMAGREEVAVASAQMVAKLVAFNDSAINEALLAARIPPALLEALRADHSDEFVQNSFYALRALGETVGLDRMDLSREAMRIITDVMKAHANDPYITDIGSKCLELLTANFAGGAEALLESHLRDLGKLINAAAAWQEVVDENGRVYYFNGTDQSTQWEQPKVHTELIQGLDDILGLLESLQDTIANINLANKTDVVTLFGSHTRDHRVAARATSVLAAFAGDAGHAQLLAGEEGMEYMVSAMGQHSTDEEMLEAASRTLAALSKFQEMRDKLSSLEYIAILNQAVRDHVRNAVLVGKALTCLGNLAYNHPTNIAYMMELQVPRTLRMAGAEHPADAGASEGLVQVASNLLFESDENKLAVCASCTSALNGVLQSFPDDPKLAIATLRCIGNLSLLDACILSMVRKKTVEKIVGVMRAQPSAIVVLRTCMEVLSNFAAMEDEENDEEATRFISEEGGIEKIIEVVRRNLRVPELLSAGLDALYNIGNDAEAAEMLVELGTVEVALNILEHQDLNTQVAGHCMRFMSVLTYCPSGVGALADYDGMEVMLHSLQNHLDEAEYLSDAMLTFSNAFVAEENRAAVRQAGGLPRIVGVMNLPVVQESPDIMKWVIKALTRLATEDASSMEVAQVGMHLFVEIVSRFIDDVDLLTLLFELYAQLAFVRDNLKVIVQAGAIKIIMKSMDFYDTNGELMVKAINVLDNVVSADEEYAQVVLQKGGKQAVERVKAANQYDRAVVQAADAAILSMDAMARTKERDGTKTNRGALFARLGNVVDLRAHAHAKVGEDLVEPTSDPLVDCRNMLRAGVLLAEYRNGMSTQRHMFISVDWNAIIIKDTAKKAKSGVRIPLRNVRKIEPGLSDGHYKAGILGGESTSTAISSRSLYITTVNDAQNVSLECRSVNQRDDLLEGLQVLVRTFRHFPNWLQL